MLLLTAGGKQQLPPSSPQQAGGGGSPITRCSAFEQWRGTLPQSPTRCPEAVSRPATIPLVSSDSLCNSRAGPLQGIPQNGPGAHAGMQGSLHTSLLCSSEQVPVGRKGRAHQVMLMHQYSYIKKKETLSLPAEQRASPIWKLRAYSEGISYKNKPAVKEKKGSLHTVVPEAENSCFGCHESACADRLNPPGKKQPHQRKQSTAARGAFTHRTSNQSGFVAMEDINSD